MSATTTENKMGTWFDLKGDARLGRCATEGCGGQPTFRLEADGVGSNYCSGCRLSILSHQQGEELSITREQNERMEAEIASLRAALKPFASGGEWGTLLAFITHGAPTRAVGIAAAKEIVGWQCAADEALASGDV